MANTMELKGKAYGADPRRAEQIYRDLFADTKIECLAAPEYRAAGEGIDMAAVCFTVAANDLDDVYDRIIIPAQSQLRALMDYEAVPERAPAQPAPQQKTTVVVNMFGGPGAGKTTAALEVAEKLKKAGYVVEYAPEYAKELVWDMNDPKGTDETRQRARHMLSGSFQSQTKMYAEQLRRIQRCIGQCDFVVTDSPAILGVAYLKEKLPQEREDFERRALRDFNSMRNFNMVVKRSGDYEQAGRYQTPEEASAIDANVEGLLERFDIFHGTYNHSQIDKAIENMQKTLRRFARQDEKPAKAGAREADAPSPREKEARAARPQDRDARAPEPAIFNFANDAGLAPAALANSLPAEVQQTLRLKLEEHFAGQVPPEKVAFAVEDLMVKPLSEAGASLSREDYNAVLDEWAVHESFDPKRVDVEEAAWLVTDEAGNQAIFEAHLTDDMSSPNGQGWYFSLNEWDAAEAKWVETDGGMYWGYADATELVDAMPAPSKLSGKLDVLRVPYDILDEAGVGAYDAEQRPVSADEIALARSAGQAAPTPPEQPFPAPSMLEAEPRANGLSGEVYKHLSLGEGHTVELTFEHAAETDDWMTTVYIDDGKFGKPAETACFTSLHSTFKEAYSRAYERVCDEVGHVGIANPEKRGETLDIDRVFAAGAAAAVLRPLAAAQLAPSVPEPIAVTACQPLIAR